MDGACFVWISVLYLLCYVHWKEKKDIVHVVLRSPFVVMSIREMCIKNQK